MSESFCIVPVTEATTIADLIEEALQKFGLQNFKSEDYRCSEILLDHGGKFLFNSLTIRVGTYFFLYYNDIVKNKYRISPVTERVLCRDEKPWEIVKQLGKDSIRQMELMRFYLQLKQDPHGPNLALFVGNLPPNLSERSYENMLTEFLGKGEYNKNHRKSIGNGITGEYLQKTNSHLSVQYTTSTARW